MRAPPAAELLAWFDGRRRDVPWRGERDPYLILVAEIMAQQTRIETVAPYYHRFTTRFPDVQALAGAREDEVLKLWEGLGYYARARNLLRTARTVVVEQGGEIPSTAEELRRLPGVGPYTAGAVASIAFGEPEPAVDGNARRVLCRLFDIEAPTPTRLARSARTLLDAARDRPGAVNQAVMDLGSEICTPRAPRCDECPVAGACVARLDGTIPDRPPARTRARRPERREAAAVIERGERVLVIRRPEDGLLGGLWDFPAVPLTGSAPARRVLSGELPTRLGLDCRIGGELRTVRHAFSHFRLHLTVHRAWWRVGEVRNERPHRWADREELDALAFPSYQRRLIDETLLD